MVSSDSSHAYVDRFVGASEVIGDDTHLFVKSVCLTDEQGDALFTALGILLGNRFTTT